MNKTDYFTTELMYIKDESIKKDALYLIKRLPDYFFEVPVSTVGKNNPKFANTKHGLIKHTKLSVRIANDLMKNNSCGFKFIDKEHDLIILALILHDGLIYGNAKDKHTVFDHPIIASKFIFEHKAKLNMDIDDLRFMCSLIETHMGEWTKDPKTNEEVLPKPTTKAGRFVHMCDFLACQKYLDIKFNNIDIEE